MSPGPRNREGQGFLCAVGDGPRRRLHVGRQHVVWSGVNGDRILPILFGTADAGRVDPCLISLGAPPVAQVFQPVSVHRIWLGAPHALSPDVRLGPPGLDSLQVRNARHQLESLWALVCKGAVVNGGGPVNAPGRLGSLAHLPPPGTDSVGPQVSGRSRGVEPDAGNVPATAVRSWVERASTSSAHAGSSARFISSRGSASWS